MASPPSTCAARDGWRYDDGMPTNLADPDREPSDEELAQLSHAAFAGVAAANERALAALRARIEAESARVLEALASRARSGPR